MLGTHIIVDAYDISDQTFVIINKDYEQFDTHISNLICKHNMTILNKQKHVFDSEYNGAFTYLYLLSESHVSFHSWPEKNYIAIDVFTCGDCNTEKLVKDIIDYINCPRFDIQIIHRGYNCDHQVDAILI